MTFLQQLQIQVQGFDCRSSFDREKLVRIARCLKSIREHQGGALQEDHCGSFRIDDLIQFSTFADEDAFATKAKAQSIATMESDVQATQDIVGKVYAVDEELETIDQRVKDACRRAEEEVSNVIGLRKSFDDCKAPTPQSAPAREVRNTQRCEYVRRAKTGIEALRSWQTIVRRQKWQSQRLRKACLTI